MHTHSIVKQSSFNSEFKQIIVALTDRFSLFLHTMHTKAYRMLINPNKTMERGERERCALSPIFNNMRTICEGAFFLMPLITRGERRRRRRRRKLAFFSNPSCRLFEKDQISEHWWLEEWMGDVCLSLSLSLCLSNWGCSFFSEHLSRSLEEARRWRRRRVHSADKSEWRRNHTINSTDPLFHTRRS